MATRRDHEADGEARGSDRPGRRPESDAQRDEHPLAGLQDQVGNRAFAVLVADEGRALTPGERLPMEASFQEDFDGVRIHEGPAVDEAASRIDAAAFTAGDHVYMADEVPDTSTPAGRLVLGEELAHVAQGVGSAGAERVLHAGDRAETEAHAAAVAAVTGDRASVTAAGPAANATGRILPGLALPIAVGVGAWLFSDDEKDDVPVEEAPPSEAPVDEVTFTPEEHGRITGGALPKLEAAKAKALAKNGQEMAAVALLHDVNVFLDTFKQHPVAGFMIVLARNDVIDAMLMLESISDEPKAVSITAAGLAEVRGVVAGAAAAAHDAAPDPNAGDTERTTLTAAEGAQLSSGALGPIDRASALVAEGEFAAAADALLGVANVLHSFTSAPVAVKSALDKAARTIEGTAEVLKALSSTIDDRCDQAGAQIDGAIGGLNALMPTPPPD